MFDGAANGIGRKSRTQTLAETGHSSTVFARMATQLIHRRARAYAPDRALAGHRLLPVLSIGVGPRRGGCDHQAGHQQRKR